VKTFLEVVSHSDSPVSSPVERSRLQCEVRNRKHQQLAGWGFWPNPPISLGNVNAHQLSAGTPRCAPAPKQLKTNFSRPRDVSSGSALAESGLPCCEGHVLGANPVLDDGRLEPPRDWPPPVPAITTKGARRRESCNWAPCRQYHACQYHGQSHVNIMHARTHKRFIVIIMVDKQSREQGVQRTGAPQLCLTHVRPAVQNTH
jgi:hypothetical protein